MRLVIGDALHSLGDLGSGALRLDANGFLGVERNTDDSPAWSEGHPLSEASNQFISSMVRKVGGFTFQELNLSIDDIARSSARGADLSYDFVTRPAYHHAMATGDTEFLRLTLHLAADLGVEPVSLVHALQNHDEMTYELVHFATVHGDEEFTFRGEELPRQRSRRADPDRAHRPADGRGRSVQLDLHPERHRLDLRHDHRRLARHDRDRQPVGRPGRVDPGRAPAAGHVQRLAAGRLRPVRVGSGGCAHARAQAGRRAARLRRHPLDPPLGVRPDGLPAGRDRVDLEDAAGQEPVRDAARPAGRSAVVRVSAGRHPAGPQPVRAGHRHPARRAAGVQPRRCW